jgi:hypothetical protein
MTSNSKTNNRSNTVDTLVFNGVLAMVEGMNQDAWVGTMTDLNSVLARGCTRSVARQLPGSPSALRVVLNRVANRLRTRGISVKFSRTTDHTRTRFVRFSVR